jgi:hypothetical protein
MGNRKNFAYVFACLLLLQVLAVPAFAAPIKFRGGKGLAYGSSHSSRDFGKHYAVSSNKILARKGNNGSKGNSKPASKPASKHASQACEAPPTCEAPKKSVHNNFNRAYETIGLCETTIDVVRNTEKCVDYIATQCLSFQTLQEHKTKYNVLRDTQANQRYVECFGATIERLTNVCKTVQTLVPISVSIDIIATQEACVQDLSARSACVKTLREIKKNARYMKSAKACARRVTGAGGKIKAIHRVHQKISQEISRSVTCGSNNENNNKGSKHGEDCGTCAPAPTQC